MSAARRVIGWTAAVVVAGAAVLVLQDWRFWVRWVRVPSDAEVIDRGAGGNFPVEWIGEGPGRDVPVASGSERTIPADALAKAAAYAKEKESFAFVVYHRGRIQREDYSPGKDAATVFNTQSMHRSVMSLMVVHAARRGAIPSLDAKASQWLPEWQGDARSQITVRQLLGLASGLANVEYDERNPFSSGIRLFFTSDARAFALATPLGDPPGTKFELAHPNAQVLEAVLARATGVPYAEYVRRELWEPLGGGQAGVFLDRPGGAARTVCCFLTTARGWMKLGALLAEGGKVGERQVLEPETIRETIEGNPWKPAFGFFIRTVPSAGGRYYALTGRGGQSVLVSPEEDLVVVRIGPLDDRFDTNALMEPLLKGIVHP